MEPVTSAAEMRAADVAAQASIGLETLIARAGFAVAQHALDLLGGAYGRRVLVLAGRGHNGDDGRVAAGLLARRGARVETVAPGERALVGEVDLLIDAAFGTGFRGEFDAPAIDPRIPVLAVDLPSGLDADTGASAGALRARRTVTFQARKPGLLLGDGPDLAGEVCVADIGLVLGPTRASLVVDEDLEEIPLRRRTGHKWDAAVYVVAGSPGMRGAAALVASGALRAGAGMVRVSTPGGGVAELGVIEAVERPLPAEDFAGALLGELGRIGCLVLGPGLGAPTGIVGDLEAILAGSRVPVVLDADGLNALAGSGDPIGLARRCAAPLVLTPHEGEFARLHGGPVGPDRVAAVRDLAAAAGAVVLLKGATTVVAQPDGTTYLVTSGSARLSTGGTGDVLAGVIGALIARGLPAGRAAAIGAHLHGRAASTVDRVLTASDLPIAIGELLARIGW